MVVAMANKTKLSLMKQRSLFLELDSVIGKGEEPIRLVSKSQKKLISVTVPPTFSSTCPAFASPS